MMDKDTTPVKVSVLRVLYKGLKPIRDRLDCILEDYYKKSIILSQAELTAALEFRSAASTVELLLLDYFQQVEEAAVETLYLPTKEFQLLLDLSRTAELAYRAPLANSGLWTH
tara:strand:+ start:3867 stop:4205 length:339 start_codon:yes stop_codon:yes gene_type:complete